MSEGLETVPRKVVDYRGARFEEMDTEAILRRHPEVAIVDEFPHTNVPGSARLKRWEDVDVLLDAGHRCPDDDERAASGELERPNLAEHRRPRAGNDSRLGAQASRRGRDGRSHAGRPAQQARARRVYAPERAEAALQNFFKESTLVALRELAMRQAAYVVESRLPSEDESSSPGYRLGPESQARERLLLSSARIRRVRR